jgi:hypothetical protein
MWREIAARWNLMQTAVSCLVLWSVSTLDFPSIYLPLPHIFPLYDITSLVFSLVFLFISHFVSVSNYLLFILIFLYSFLFLFLHILIETNIDIVEGREIERKVDRKRREGERWEKARIFPVLSCITLISCYLILSFYAVSFLSCLYDFISMHSIWFFLLGIVDFTLVYVEHYTTRHDATLCNR